VTATLCFVFRVEAEVHERIVAFAGFHDDVATASTIPSRRTAAGNELLATKRNTAVAAVTSLYADLCLIDKHLEILASKQEQLWDLPIETFIHLPIGSS
jgi:hypothetical protein